MGVRNVFRLSWLQTRLLEGRSAKVRLSPSAALADRQNKKAGGEPAFWRVVFYPLSVEEIDD
jgi:hypothetical protein